jgi:hypothetical protein
MITTNVKVAVWWDQWEEMEIISLSLFVPRAELARVLFPETPAERIRREDWAAVRAEQHGS